MKNKNIRNLQKADIALIINGKDVSFPVWHTLPGGRGLSIEAAVGNWLVRTDDFTAESLCNYINSKGAECKAWASNPRKK